MELVTLDENFQPRDLVENYESLVWSERYSSNGDFELVSYDVEGTLNLLPIETPISILESTVPMIVEVAKITKSANSGPKITLTGRSFETVLERRASVNQLPSDTTREAWVLSAGRESDAAYKAIRAVIGDIARHQGSLEVLPAVAGADLVSPLDIIPGVTLPLPMDYVPNPETTPAWSSSESYVLGSVVSHSGSLWRSLTSVSSGQAPPDQNAASWSLQASEPVWTEHVIKPGDLYSTALELVKVNHRAIRSVRPATDGNVISIEVYNGANLTETVVLDARFDQFDSSTYLFSLQASTNVAYVYGSNGSQVVLKNAVDPDNPEPSGLDRRVALVDEANDNLLNTEDIRKSRGLVELYKRNATSLFDGEVSFQVAEGYNRDYFLGDLISLVGEYGLSSKVRVAEFIRTQDASGEKAYPTFEVVDELS